MPRLLSTLALALFLVSFASSVSAQSINIDFGGNAAPADNYPAAGGAGRWNLIGVLPAYTRAALVDIAGSAIAARVYMYGGTQLLLADDPATSGDDGALMDDMLIGWNDPVDECLWIEGLVVDDYEVLIYAMTPSDPLLMCRVRVDDGTPGPVYVGGAWPGAHQKGVSYERFVVHATGGLIAFHSGLYGGYLQSGMNGVQIRPLSTTSVGSGPANPGSVKLGAVPNPSHGTQPVEFALSSAMPPGRLELFDAAGRLLWSTTIGEGRSQRWDGRDLDGRVASNGVLFARWSDLASRSSQITARIVRLP